MNELSKKNTEAFRQGLEDAQTRLSDQQERIVKLEELVSTLLQRVNELEPLVRVQQALSRGCGPTVR